jgi:hypothetical protein
MSNPYSVAALKADIAAGALASQLASLAGLGDCSSIAALYNAIDGSRDKPVAIPSVWLLQWAASTGVRTKIESAANDAANAANSAALAIRDYWWGVGNQASFDLASPLISSLLDALAGASILNASGPGSKADLLTWGTVPCSYAESTWSPPTSIDQAQNIARGTVVTAGDVGAALALNS